MYVRNILFICSTGEHLVREPHPMGRAAHAAVCVGYGGDHPQLLVIGGMAADDYHVLEDAWMLDVQSGKWREVRFQSSYMLSSLCA